MKEPEKIIRYTDSDVFKFKNKRISVVTRKNGDYVIEMKVLSEDHEPRAHHDVSKGKMVTTAIALTPESALAIMLGLKQRLKEDGII